MIDFNPTSRHIPARPPLAVATYIITLQDVSGPFTKIPRVRGGMPVKGNTPGANFPSHFESSLDLLRRSFTQAHACSAAQSRKAVR